MGYSCESSAQCPRLIWQVGWACQLQNNSSSPTLKEEATQKLFLGKVDCYQLKIYALPRKLCGSLLQSVARESCLISLAVIALREALHEIRYSMLSWNHPLRRYNISPISEAPVG